jgi:hypothetical protein
MNPGAGSVSAIYHSIPQRGGPQYILDFAVEYASVDPAMLLSQSPIPNTIPSSILSAYFSKASLKDLSQVEICKVSEPSPRCMGLLLHYGNGSREVVGQYRWDNCTSHDIRSCKTVSFQWAGSKDSRAYLTDICFGGMLSGNWTLEGEIIWWFNWDEDFISVNGQNVFGQTLT